MQYNELRVKWDGEEMEARWGREVFIPKPCVNHVLSIDQK